MTDTTILNHDSRKLSNIHLFDIKNSDGYAMSQFLILIHTRFSDAYNKAPFVRLHKPNIRYCVELGNNYCTFLNKPLLGLHIKNLELCIYLMLNVAF